MESKNVTFDEKEAVTTSSHRPSDHATTSHFDESPSDQSDFITESLFPDTLDLEEYKNPRITTSTTPPIVDEPVTTSNSSGAIVTESSSQTCWPRATVDVEISTEIVGQKLTPEPSLEQSITFPQEQIQHPIQEDTLAIVLYFEPVTTSSEETSSTNLSKTHSC